jgi:hypothetical protein
MRASMRRVDDALFPRWQEAFIPTAPPRCSNLSCLCMNGARRTSNVQPAVVRLSRTRHETPLVLPFAASCVGTCHSTMSCAHCYSNIRLQKPFLALHLRLLAFVCLSFSFLHPASPLFVHCPPSHHTANFYPLLKLLQSLLPLLPPSRLTGDVEVSPCACPHAVSLVVSLQVITHQYYFFRPPESLSSHRFSTRFADWLTACILLHFCRCSVGTSAFSSAFAATLLDKA